MTDFFIPCVVKRVCGYNKKENDTERNYRLGKYFGTDGFRGEAGVVLTAEHAFRLGQVLGSYFKRDDGRRTRAVIGKDTRRSSYMLEYAIASGLASAGADAHMLHVTTTPSVSYVTVNDGFDIGIMISASHNPYYDNGIKVVDTRGEKLSDAVIDEIERMMDDKKLLPSPATGCDVGEIVDYYAGRNRYIGYLISLSRHSFRDYNVALDCANGGAWMIAKSVFEALGARVHAVGVEPNGRNINDGVGSTHIENLSKYVREVKADIGFAFDGDADRCIAVDECGNVVNGDHIIYILARSMMAAGELHGNTVVTTVMSNLGLYRALDAAGIAYEKTAVGDRYVAERMRESGYVLGGEQSGHTILSKYATTGDGILTAIKVMEAVIKAKLPLSKLASPVKMFPQVLINIRTEDKAVIEDPEVRLAAKTVEERLGDGGRLLLRKSGTEPLVRVMVEAESDEISREMAETVASVIRRKVGLV